MLVGTLLLLAAFARADAPEEEAPEPEADAPEPAPLTWGATDALYRITIPPEGPLTLALEWRFAAVEPAWMDVPLAGLPLVVESVTGPAIAGPYGLRALLSPASNAATVTVRGTLDPARPGAAALPVLPAARQRVIVDAPGLDVTVAGAKDGWLAAASELALTWKPKVTTTPSAPPPLAHAEASTAVWAEPGALITRAAVRWRVARGEVGRFELDVAGLDEVEVTGPNLESATRAGDRMVLTPREPVRGTFAVDVRARRALSGDGEVAAPAPRPLASRVERYWTVGRAEDGELVPVGGPRAVAAKALPEWARGLSDTPPESFWQGDTPLRVRLARFTPLMGPDTVIERAELVVAAAAEGRSLVRTTWHVRNERRQYLHVRPAPGLRPMTARVSGEPVSVLSDGADGVYVPLEKSVETVQGLLTFPVELTWIAEGDAWGKNGERTLKLPAVDAPIQAADWEVYLPRGWTSKRKARRSAVEAPPPPPPPVNVEAEEALQSAVSAYKSNKFEEAQEYLEVARSAGSTSANVGRLQSNLDVLLGGSEEVEDVATRRVRDLANAKTVTMQVEQEKKADKARDALQSGDVEEAERYLQEVIALADDIGVTEQKESAEQAGKKAEAEQLLEEVAAVKNKRKASGSSSSTLRRAEDRDADELDTSEAWEGEGVEGGVVGGVLGGVLAGGEDDNRGFGLDGVGLGGGGAGDGGGAPSTAATPTTVTTTPISQVVPVVEAVPISEPVPLAEAPADDARTTDTSTSTVQRVLQVLPGVTRTPARRDAKPAKAARDGKDAAVVAAPAPQPVAAAPAQPTAPAEPFAPETPAPEKPAPAGRAALLVKAAPLTLALPLDGELVRDSAALLPADAHPTLTLSYKQSGADR